MKTQWLVSAKVLGLSILILGVIYPLVLFMAGRAFFPFRSGGSILREGDIVLGSELIAQDFSKPGYFQPRPSACGFDPLGSGGSNLAPTSARLLETYKERVGKLRQANPGADEKVPIELVASSSSGLDPHLSLGAALWQVPRVAREMGLSEEIVEILVRRSAAAPLLGFIGEWRVNVLNLNRQLDRFKSLKKTAEND